MNTPRTRTDIPEGTGYADLAKQMRDAAKVFTQVTTVTAHELKKDGMTDATRTSAHVISATTTLLGQNGMTDADRIDMSDKLGYLNRAGFVALVDTAIGQLEVLRDVDGLRRKGEAGD